MLFDTTSIRDLLILRPKRHLDPRGFLHGFLTLERDTEVQYKADNPYAPECDGAVAWNDPDLAIDWPITAAPVLSAKDAAAPGFSEWETPFELGHPE